MSEHHHLRTTYTPAKGTEPSARLSPYLDTIGIPIVVLSSRHELVNVEVMLDHEDLTESVRYLRALAEATTTLADQIEEAAAR